MDNQTVVGNPLTFIVIMGGKYYGSQWGPLSCLVTDFLQNFFVLIQVWNNF